MTQFAEKHYPEVLLPEELDAYLEKGWYRMGQTVFTTHFLCFDLGFFSAIWIRQDLQNFIFNKRQRKLLHRNGHLFHFSWQPATITEEKELLYSRYRAAFKGLLSPSLRENLLDGEEYHIFSTYEITIYDGSRLIGLSYFDLGHNSAASIMGIYDPEYQRYSIGYYSMLLEMLFCQKHNRRFYYPGYVVPGYQRFDYKLRIGSVEYYHLPSGDWLPYDNLQPDDIPLRKMHRQLSVLQSYLPKHQIQAQLQYYPLFEANLFGFWNAPYLDHPLVVKVLPSEPLGFHLLVTFDIREELYNVLVCNAFDDMQIYFNNSLSQLFFSDQYFTELVIVDRVAFQHREVGAVASWIEEQLQ